MENIISFVDYADDKFGRKNGQYKKVQEKRSELLYRSGVFHRILNWDWEQLVESSFPKIPRSHVWNGFSFKPLIILDSLSKIPNDSFLLYHDCSPQNTPDYKTGPLFMKSYDSILPFLSNLDYGIDFLCPLLNYSSRHYTKRDCFKIMGCNNSKYMNSFQICASWILIKNTHEIVRFVKEWLYFNLNTDVASYKPSLHSKDFKDYKQNRGDQPIINNLMIKYEKKCCYIKDPFLAETKDFSHYLQASEDKNLGFSLIPDIKV
tara:strand:- start:977 stop:1762 length:786 start_codon:yes stop_codon:yes gene_type:complete